MQFGMMQISQFCIFAVSGRGNQWQNHVLDYRLSKPRSSAIAALVFGSVLSLVPMAINAVDAWL